MILILKQIGGDIVQNKKTYLVLKALERATSEQRLQLKELLSSRPIDEEGKIKLVTQLFNDLNIKELANQKKDDYHQRALKNLDTLKIDVEKLLPLKKKKEQPLLMVTPHTMKHYILKFNFSIYWTILQKK